MIYAFAFSLAIMAGWVVSARHVKEPGWRSAISVIRRGNAELRTMCILTAVWVGTITVNLWTSAPYPIAYYVSFDIAAVAWLLWNQTKNWQWIPTALFAVMLLTHLMFIIGVSFQLIPNQSRPSQDILAVLGYLQILSVGTMAMQRRSNAGSFVRWGFRTDWVLVRRLGYTQDAGSQR